MRQRSTSTGRRRATAATLVVAMLAAAATVLGSAPAGAATADLETPDGLGIRIDENALLGGPLDAIESELHPFVLDMIEEGATDDDAPFGSHVGLQIQANLDLGLDFLVPDGVRPDGGLTVDALISNIEIRYEMDPVWPFANCYIWVRPDPATVDVTARVDRSNLPDTPLTIEPVSAYWDDSPSVTSNGVCWSYVAWTAVSNWWNNIWSSSNPESTAAKIEARLNAEAQVLIDDLWADYVAPVIGELQGFGIDWGQIRTDDNGLIITAHTDAGANGGLTIPGIGGPFDVSGAGESGASSDINALLAERDDVIVSIHPNVVNQLSNAIWQVQNGQMAAWTVSNGAALEEFLLPDTMWDNFTDHQWNLTVTALTNSYYFTPSDTDGAPQMTVPNARFRVTHPQHFFGIQPVATFYTEVTGADLITEDRGDGTWGPSVVPGPDLDVQGTLSTVPNEAIQAVRDHGPDAAGLLPWAAETIERFNQLWVVNNLSLAPLEIAGFSVDLCDTCGPYPGDERYTEAFLVS